MSTRLLSTAPAGLLAGAIGLCSLSALAGLESCAHVAAPPGGPQDTIPPVLIAVLPDSFAIVPGFDDEVKFQFSESISERGVEGSTTLYPFEPRPRVKKGGRELRVRPREGWVENRIYHIRIEPTITDLFQNRIEQPIVHVISTGVPITENLTQGVIYDRITGQPLPGGRIDMVKVPDTLRYGGVADSVGAYELEMLPAGDYLAIGYEDVNNNRQADDFDRSDTVQVSLDAAEALTLDFQVFRHDTIGPRLVEVKPIDTLVVELTFDGYLDPEAPLDRSNIEIYALADSLPIQIDTVLHAWQYTAWRDSVQEARRAAADSAAAAAAADSAAAAAADTLGVEADTLPVVPDTLAAPPDTAEAEPPPPVEPPAEAVPTEEGQEEAEAEEPAMLPDQRIYVVARARIPSGTHVVRFVEVLNLNQLPGEGEAEFEPIEPPPEESEEQEPPPDPPPAPDR